MKKGNTQRNENGISAELSALLDNTRPLEELDLDAMAVSIRELDSDHQHVAEVCKGTYVEDVLCALMEEGVSKAQLAKMLGKTRQQMSYLLNESNLNNFTIETMAEISTALGRHLTVRMLSPSERFSITPVVLEHTSYFSREELFDLPSKNHLIDRISKPVMSSYAEAGKRHVNFDLSDYESMVA